MKSLVGVCPELHRLGRGARAGEGDSRDVCCSSSWPRLRAAVSLQGCGVPRPVNPCCMPRSAMKAGGDVPALMEFTPSRGPLFQIINKPLAVKVPESCSLSFRNSKCSVYFSSRFAILCPFTSHNVRQGKAFFFALSVEYVI